MRTWKKCVLGLVASAALFSAGFVCAIRVVADELPDATNCRAEGGCAWVTRKNMDAIQEQLKQEALEEARRHSGAFT